MTAWLPAPAAYSLPDDEVHVWRVGLAQPEWLRQQFAASLAADEGARAARFHFERHRHAYVVARGFMRALLGRYLNIPPRQVAFVYGPQGKPALAPGHGRDLRFNLAHAGEWALLALAHGRDVGVDLEPIRPLEDADAIAARFFSPAEYAAWRALPAPQKPAAFFNAWTRKEAFIKLLGTGLSYPLRDFDVSLAPGEAAQLLRVAGAPDAANRWQLLALDLAPGYRAALAVAGRDWRFAGWHFAP